MELPGEHRHDHQPQGQRDPGALQQPAAGSCGEGYGTPADATWISTYDPAVLAVATITDPNGHVSRAADDAAANRLTATDALGHTSTLTFDGMNDLTSVTDPLGITTPNTYDGNGNLTSVVWGCWRRGCAERRVSRMCWTFRRIVEL